MKKHPISALERISKHNFGLQKITYIKLEHEHQNQNSLKVLLKRYSRSYYFLRLN